MPGVPGLSIPESDEELFELVWRDDLTGLYNRRFFARFMKQEADWSDGAPPLSLAMMDLDNLKRINDRLGHMAGDATLKRLGEIFKAAVPEGQFAVRYAGDEFALILPNTSREDALELADQLREAVVKDDYEGVNLPDGLRPSLSIGVALFPEDAPSGGDELTEAADKALYYSKRTGKNKVTSAATIRAGAEEVSDLEALAGFPSRTLVGRRPAFQTIDEAISLALDERTGFLLVEGPPGSGKTRLLSELAKYGKERELAVLIEKCSVVTREEPYRALGGLLERYLKARGPRLDKALAALSPAQRAALREVIPDLPAPARRSAGAASSGERPALRPPPRRPGPPGRRPPPRRPGPGDTGRLRGRPRPRPRPGPGGPHESGRWRAARRPGAPPRPGPEGSGRWRAPQKPDPAELTVSIFTGLVELLTQLSKVQPLVVILDDVHYADEPTLEVISRCLPREGGRILFVGAARPQEATGDDAPPYVAFRASLGEHSNAFRIALEPLGREQVSELATNLLEGFTPPTEFVDRLHELSEGNPLYVEGALRHLIENQKIVRTPDGWRSEGPIPAELPLTLDELIRGQLKVLDEATAALLGRAAVVGPNFEFDVLRASLPEGTPEGQALDMVAGAVRANLLEETGEEEGPDLEFRSEAVREETYEELPPDERQDAHRRVAEAIGPEAGSAALAYHFGRAGDQQKRDRFVSLVRERMDAVFDREAIENLGEERLRIPEVSDAPPEAFLGALPGIAKAIATAAKTVRLYPPTSKVVSENLDAVLVALNHGFEHLPAFTLSHRGNALMVNGQTVDKASGEGQFQEAVAGIFRVNSIKSLTFVKMPAKQELLAFLTECAQHSVQAAIPRHFWRVFAREHGLEHVGVAQKSFVLKNKRPPQLERRAGPKRIAEEDLPLVKDLVRHLMAAIDGVRKYPPGSKVPSEAMANLDRALRQLFHSVPALAIHEGGKDEIVVNGTPLQTGALPAGGAELYKLLSEGKLTGVVMLRDLTPRELARFVTRIARLGPRDFEKGQDPLARISGDGSFPNVIVGEALFQLADDLIAKKKAPDTAEEEGEDVKEAAPAEATAELPKLFRDQDLPADFEWPSDADAKRAQALCELTPKELIVSPNSGEFVDVLELLLVDGRPQLALRLIERLAITFAGQEPLERARAADMFLQMARKGSQELRESYFAVAVRRLSDAIELETDYDAFEKLCEAARIGILERIAEGDWDTASRLVWSMVRRRETRAETQARMRKVALGVLGKVLEDPRCERVFDTIETGSQQERRKAARILEGMGAVAVDRLVAALQSTGRGRVETFLIDMLAALAPDSERALQKAVTPFAPSESTRRLLRAAGVVCRDPTDVLVSGLQNPDQLVQTESVTVARSVGGPVAQRVLTWALEQGSPAAQLAAVKHLGELARPEALDGLLDLVQKTGIVEVQRECCLAFGKLALNRQGHEKVVPVLSGFLRPGGFLRGEAHEDVRAAAAWSLGQMTSIDAARKALERALDDKDKRVRLTARLTLKGK